MTDGKVAAKKPWVAHMRNKGWHLHLFWNGSGRCFTARWEDRHGNLLPKQGDILWAADAASPMGALKALLEKTDAWANGIPTADDVKGIMA